MWPATVNPDRVVVKYCLLDSEQWRDHRWSLKLYLWLTGYLGMGFHHQQSLTPSRYQQDIWMDRAHLYLQLPVLVAPRSDPENTIPLLEQQSFGSCCRISNWWKTLRFFTVIRVYATNNPPIRHTCRFFEYTIWKNNQYLIGVISHITASQSDRLFVRYNLR